MFQQPCQHLKSEQLALSPRRRGLLRGFFNPAMSQNKVLLFSRNLSFPLFLCVSFFFFLFLLPDRPTFTRERAIGNEKFHWHGLSCSLSESFGSFFVFYLRRSLLCVSKNRIFFNHRRSVACSFLASN